MGLVLSGGILSENCVSARAPLLCKTFQGVHVHQSFQKEFLQIKPNPFELRKLVNQQQASLDQQRPRLQALTVVLFPISTGRPCYRTNTILTNILETCHLSFEMSWCA